jgi:imidazolonepropionase-like amidohydrolase
VTGSGPLTPLHVRGVVLPTDTERDLWTDSSGRISDEPVPDAQTVAVGAFIVPGLVDAHCHVGLDEHGGVDEQEQERQIIADRDAGTLLIRDAGVPVDTHWIDGRADLPRVIRAGRHIARTRRYIRNFGAEIEPGDLVA